MSIENKPPPRGRFFYCLLSAYNGIRAASEKIVARSDDEREDVLRKRGFSKAETGRIVETVLAEEGRLPESVFDFVQGITAVARSKPQQDARLVMEGKAKALLEKINKLVDCLAARIARRQTHCPNQPDPTIF